MREPPTGAAFDAVIVGAGPAGATAAVLLARAGWSVALIEKQLFPRRKVCGECVAASNLPLLDALGVGAAFEAVAGPELRQVGLLHGTRCALAALPAAAHPRHRWGRVVGREALDALLLAQARRVGARVFQPWSVHRIDGGPGAWRCQIRTSNADRALDVQAPLLIAANGSWEALPALAHAAFSLPAARQASDLFAFKANFRAAALAPGVLPVFALDGGYGGMVVAGDGVATVACCVRRDRLDAVRRAAPGVRAGDAVDLWLRRECAGVRAALQPARRDAPWLAVGPLAPGDRLDADDGLLRIGNAAGEAHPIIGEGISMALQSAWLLCAELFALAERGVPDAAAQRVLRQRYAARWRREFGTRLHLAGAFAALAMRPAGAASLLTLARLAPALLTWGARWGGKLRCAVDAATLAAPVAAWAASPAVPTRFAADAADTDHADHADLDVESHPASLASRPQ